MAKRLKWVKAMLSEVIQDGKYFYIRPDKGGIRGSSQFIRFLCFNNGESSFRSDSFRRKRRGAAAPAESAHKFMESGSTLKEAVADLINLVYNGIVIKSYSYVDVLRGCFKHKDLESLKKVHDCIKKSQLEENPFLNSNLLKCYIECGRLQNARELFDRVLNKSIVSWNLMMRGYVENCQAENAIEVYNKLRSEGGQPDAITYLTVLKACARPSALKWGKDVHAHILRDGFKPDVRVGTALVSMYAKCGSIEDARTVFDKMERRNEVSWNTMIGGLAQHGLGHEAVSLFHQMQREGFTPSVITYLCMLSAKPSPEDLAWVKEIHSHVAKSGLEKHLWVNNALIFMYSRCGSMECAKLVFDNMEKRDVISWNAVIGGLARQGRGQEALTCFHQMQTEGVAPNVATYTSILSSNAGEGALTWVKEIHDHAARSGLKFDLRLNNALVQMYANSGSIELARVVFDNMEERDVISWNMMIGGLAQYGSGREAFSLFLQMEKEGILPDSITYVSILNPCSSTGALEWVKEIHAHATKAGLDLDLRVGNALVHMYAKIGRVEEARYVFNRMEDRDIITWNAMIGGLALHGFGHEAFSLFVRMEREGFIPNAVTYLSILKPCSSTGAYERLKEIHAHAVKTGLDVDLRVGNALIHMYAKSGSIEDAKTFFDRMRERSVISWTAMIGGLAQHGLGREAFSLFLQMQREGFTPDTLTYVSILNPCSSTGALRWVKEVHDHALTAGHDADLRVGNALVHMYAKIGCIVDARKVFDKMSVRDVVSWTVMIGGLAQHGHGREALQLFEQMKSEGFEFTEQLFVALLSACNHAGLVDEGRSQFVSMTRDHNVRPALEQYTCLVDIVGRAGHLEEAKRIILNMPVQPDGVIWKALLGACKIYNNPKLGELAAKECLKLEPMDPFSYVLLSNIYAAVGSWDQVSLIRQMMEEKGIRKDPGLSWIEVDNKLHHFVAGDTSHPEAKEIYATLYNLYERMKGEGYIPDTRLVLRNLDEEDKQSALFSHSEKLAIAYGLMHVTPGEPIRLFKNLRMCTDCHTATKLISNLTGREIVARDANRFHHFKDGACSCSDYW